MRKALAMLQENLDKHQSVNQNDISQVEYGVEERINLLFNSLNF